MDKKRNILVVSAHPDDEILGCGGVARLHVEAGDTVHAVIACEGESVRYNDSSIRQADFIEQSARIIGYEKVHKLDFSDQQLDTVALIDIARPLERIIDEFRPSIVYTQFGGDVNQDHRQLFQAVNIASRPTRNFIESVLAFDTASSTEWAFPRSFVPDTWVDISAVLSCKLDALACYKSEICESPHPRSLKGVEYKARSWGAQACMEAAEVFMTVRRIQRS